MGLEYSLAGATEAVLRADYTLIQRPHAFYAALCDIYDSEQRTTEMQVLGICMDERMLDPYAAAFQCDAMSVPSQLGIAESNAIGCILARCSVGHEAAESIARQLARGVELYLGMAKTQVVQVRQEPRESWRTQVTPQSHSRLGSLTRRCSSCGQLLDEGDHICTHCGPGTWVEVRDEHGRVVNTYRTEGDSPQIKKKTQRTRIYVVLACILMVALVGVVAFHLSGKTSLNPPESPETSSGLKTDEPDTEVGAAKKLFSADEFPRTWRGTYDGYSEYTADNTIMREIAMSFTRVNENGDVIVTCGVDGGGTGSGSASGTYQATGHIDWETGYIKVQGTKWIDQGDLLGMGGFKGTIDPSSWAIAGGIWFDPEGEAKDGVWHMRSADSSSLS